jgi:hypothetical protein
METKPFWGRLGVSRDEPRELGVLGPRTDSRPMLPNHSFEWWAPRSLMLKSPSNGEVGWSFVFMVAAAAAAAAAAAFMRIMIGRAGDSLVTEKLMNSSMSRWFISGSVASMAMALRRYWLY